VEGALRPHITRTAGSKSPSVALECSGELGREVIHGSWVCASEKGYWFNVLRAVLGGLKWKIESNAAWQRTMAGKIWLRTGGKPGRSKCLLLLMPHLQNLVRSSKKKKKKNSDVCQAQTWHQGCRAGLDLRDASLRTHVWPGSVAQVAEDEALSPNPSTDSPQNM
jgi:hypothetical protein